MPRRGGNVRAHGNCIKPYTPRRFIAAGLSLLICRAIKRGIFSGKDKMTLIELLQYHACEGGLIDSAYASELASDAGIDTDGVDLDQLADSANAFAIAETMRGNVLGARLFKTDDGYTIAEMHCGTITDGDIEWSSESAFAASMLDHGIKYNVMRVT